MKVQVEEPSKPDSLDAIKYQRMLMIMTGMWPFDNRTISYKMKNVLVFFWMIFGTGVLTIELYVQIGHMEAFTNIVTIWISVVCTIVKNVIYEFKRESFKSAINKINEPIFKQYPDELKHIIEETISKTIKICCFYQLSCLAALILLCGGQFFTWPVTPLFPITFFETTPFSNLLMHMLETSTMVICACNNSCLDTVSGGFIAIATGNFKVLNGMIKDVRTWTNKYTKTDEVDNALVNKWLAHCVKHHIAILDFIGLVERNFSIGYLMQFCGSIIVICNVGFQLVHAEATSHVIAMGMYFMAMLTQLILYCWLGNELLLESTTIQDSCYLSDWINFDTKVRKTLFIIMERSKRPVYLTAGKFANLSLDSFKSILKSAYSYFALMQTLYRKKANDAAM